MQRSHGYLLLACTWLCPTQSPSPALLHMQRSCPAQLSQTSAGVSAAQMKTGCTTSVHMTATRCAQLMPDGM